jgi:putative inorganic carbon (HCO3(-)) transporter
MPPSPAISSTATGSGGVFQERKGASPALFVLYCAFTIDFYVRFSARVPALGSLRPTLLLFAALVVLLFIQRGNLKGRINGPAAKYLVVLLAFIAVSLPFTSWPGSVMRNFGDFLRTVAFFPFMLLIVDSPRRFFFFLWTVVACQLFRVLEPLYLNITEGYMGDSTHLGGSEFAGRLAGSPHDVVNPNGLGFIAVTCIPFLYYMLFDSGRLLLKALGGALILACIYVLILTMSRGAMVALAVTFLVILLNSPRKMLLIVAGLAICVAGWSQLNDVQQERYLSLFSKNTRQSSTAAGRIELTQFEFSVAMQRPVFGHGLGTTAEAKAHSGHGAQAAHNLYTEVLIELGVLGAIIYFGFLNAIRRQISSLLAAATTMSASKLQMTKAFNTLFWSYAVFSINYFGLSQDYWYVLAGMVFTFVQVLAPGASTGAPSGKLPSNEHRRP